MYSKRSKMVTAALIPHRHTEKLWKHLEEVDMECNDMMDMLTVRMAEREGVTEHLKSVDQLGWVRKMNNIRSRAEEVVLHDLIYMD